MFVYMASGGVGINQDASILGATYYGFIGVFIYALATSMRLRRELRVSFICWVRMSGQCLLFVSSGCASSGARAR